MENVYLDTHAVVWIYDRLLAKFSDKALKAIESSEILVSPIVLLELEYLFEIDRITVSSISMIEYLEQRINLKVDEQIKPSRWFVTSLQEKWTRDPFDRLIVSHAKMKSAPLISKDRSILKHYSKALW